ncbi:MAG: hypothetical protein AB1566_09500 [Chloroflexota bacterium]
MGLVWSLGRLIVGRLGVPSAVLAYLQAKDKIGHPSPVGISRECISIEAHLIGRAWLNSAVLELNRAGVLPYWAQAQYDPQSTSFIPRGQGLLSLNVTHRDWTSLGNLAADREAIVDPRGLLTPWFNGWSLDFWLLAGGRLLAPSRLKGVKQRVLLEPPCVVTEFQEAGLGVRAQAFATQVEGGEWLFQEVAVANLESESSEAIFYFALRPYNPEGLSLVHSLEFADDAFLVDGNLALALTPPAQIEVSTLQEGDVALRLPTLRESHSIRCPAGLANGVAAYPLRMARGESRSFYAAMPLVPTKARALAAKPLRFARNYRAFKAEAQRLWQDKLAQGMRLKLPEARMQEAFEANVAYLLMFHDGKDITPGPYTGHDFRFRDAAYLVAALDRVGYPSEARQVLATYPGRQRADGLFISQNGGWDANGQAIWALVQHYRLTGDQPFLAQVYPSILKGAAWIRKKRETTKREPSPHYGLLPPGTAEAHLGPNDYFYWDNFWCLAGLQEAAYATQVLGDAENLRGLQATYRAFKDDVERSLANMEERLGAPLLTASPCRQFDSAAVGSLCSLYPLRLLEPDDRRVLATLAALKERCFVEDVLFHDVGHSAFGTYLNMHIAQCHIFRRSGEALPIIDWLLRHATPTYTWAAGINPLTRGGGVGDGHHGWATADFLLLVRNLLFFEDGATLVLTPAMPQGWLKSGGCLQVANAPSYFGPVSFQMSLRGNQVKLSLDCAFRRPPLDIELNLTAEAKGIVVDGVGGEATGKTVHLPPHCRQVSVTLGL